MLDWLLVMLLEKVAAAVAATIGAAIAVAPVNRLGKSSRRPMVC